MRDQQIEFLRLLGARRAIVYALRKKYGLSGLEPTAQQIRQWSDRTSKLIETGTKPEEAGKVAAKLEFRTVGAEILASYVEVEDLLAMTKDSGNETVPASAQGGPSSGEPCGE